MQRIRSSSPAVSRQSISNVTVHQSSVYNAPAAQRRSVLAMIAGSAASMRNWVQDRARGARSSIRRLSSATPRQSRSRSRSPSRAPSRSRSPSGTRPSRRPSQTPSTSSRRSSMHAARPSASRGSPVRAQSASPKRSSAKKPR